MSSLTAQIFSKKLSSARGDRTTSHSFFVFDIFCVIWNKIWMRESMISEPSNSLNF